MQVYLKSISFHFHEIFRLSHISTIPNYCYQQLKFDTRKNIYKSHFGNKIYCLYYENEA